MTPLRVVIRLSQRWRRSLQGYEWLRESRMVGTSCHLNSFVAAIPAAVARISVTRREGCYCWRQCFATYSAVYGANESYYLRLIHTTCIWCVRVQQTGWTLELFPLVRQCTLLLHLHPHASNAHCVNGSLGRFTRAAFDACCCISAERKFSIFPHCTLLLQPRVKRSSSQRAFTAIQNLDVAKILSSTAKKVLQHWYNKVHDLLQFHRLAARKSILNNLKTIDIICKQL